MIFFFLKSVVSAGTALAIMFLACVFTLAGSSFANYSQKQGK